MTIHSSAYVHPAATIHPTAEIGPHVVIDGSVTIEADCRIAAGVYLLGQTVIGPRTQIHAHAVIGDLPQDRAFNEADDSRLDVGADCVIREGVTIHRPTGDHSQTRVGDGCRLLTNAHVAHNCIVGNSVLLESGVLLGGHVQVGDHATIEMNSAVHQFVRIGERVRVESLTKIVQDVPPFMQTDHEGSICDLNLGGLAEAGFDDDTVCELRAIYNIMYGSPLPKEEALRAIQAVAQSEAGCRFLQFFGAISRRGIRKRSYAERAVA